MLYNFIPRILLGLFLIGTVYTNSLSAQTTAPELKQQLAKQLQTSCVSLSQYQKQVASEGKTESLTFKRIETADTLCTLKSPKSETNLPVEVESAFTSLFLETAIAPEFTVQKSDHKLTAKRNKDASSLTDLQFQEISFAPDGKRLQRITSHYHHDSYLYETDIKITVSFDEQGRYVSHQTDQLTRISFIDMEFVVKLNGKASYSASTSSAKAAR